MGGLWDVLACPPPLILPGGGPGLQVGAGGASGSGQLQPAGAEHVEEAADPKIPRGHVRRGPVSLGGVTRAWGGSLQAWGGHYSLGGSHTTPLPPPNSLQHGGRARSGPSPENQSGEEATGQAAATASGGPPGCLCAPPSRLHVPPGCFCGPPGYLHVPPSPYRGGPATGHGPLGGCRAPGGAQLQREAAASLRPQPPAPALPAAAAATARGGHGETPPTHPKIVSPPPLKRGDAEC